MADEIDYRDFVGRISFPRSPADLTSTTQCPACFTALRSAVCHVCGLDLAHPAAVELATASRDAAAQLDRRIELIGRIRYETGPARRVEAAPAPMTRPTPAVPAPAPAAPAPLPQSVTPRTVAAPPMAPLSPVIGALAAAPSGPRRSSVQVILLIVGISLLSVAAIFFLVYAFINYGILARSLIIGAVTVASIVVASLLRRRALTATAEGIAVLGMVLIGLDAFAIRANDFFDTGSADGLAFWGWTMLVASALFVLWSRLSGLRSPNIVGFAAFAPGLGLVAGSFAPPDRPEQLAFWLMCGLAAGGLVHRAAIVRPRGAEAVPTRLPERVIPLAVAAAGLIGAGVAALFLSPGLPWVPAVALAALALLALAHVLVLDLRRPSATPDRLAPAFGSVFATLGALLLVDVAWAVALRVEGRALDLIIAPTAATIVTLALDGARSRLAAGTARMHALTAAIAAGVVASLGAITLAGILLLNTVGVLVSSLGGAWTHPLGDRVAEPHEVEALAGLGAMLVATILAALLGRALRRRLLPIAAVAGGLVLTAVPPLVGLLLPIVILWLALGGLALAGALVARRRGLLRRGFRGLLATLALAAVGLGYLTAWASVDAWWWATAVAVAAPLVARVCFASAASRAALLGAALALLFVGACAAGRQLARSEGVPGGAATIDATLLLAVAAVLVLGASALVRGRAVTSLDRRLGFWLGGAVTLGTLAALVFLELPLLPSTGAFVPPDLAGLLLCLLTLAVLIAWALPPGTRALPPERVAASVMVTPAVYGVLDCAARLAAVPPFVGALVPTTAALLGAASSLIFAVAGAGTRLRWVRELGIALVGLPPMLLALTSFPFRDASWMVLLLSAVAVLLTAIAPDGLFSSRSPRRHLGWAALALGVLGLWWRLFLGSVDVLEPYVLPLAGALVAVAVPVWRAARRRRAADRAAPALLFAGLLVAIVPLAAEGIAGSLARPLIVGGVSAVLLLAGSMVIGGARLRPFLDAAAVAGAAGVLVTAVGRAIGVLVLPGDPDARLDGWVGAAVLLLGAAAFGQARLRDERAAGPRRAVSVGIAVAAVAAVLFLELPAVALGTVGSLRALVVVLLFCALHVVSFLVARPPLVRALAWVAIAGAAVGGVVGVATGALDPLELATAPIGVALIATGALHLASTPTARTWPWLAPGVAVLLVPSLIATAWDAPLWRLVALGVVALGVIVISVVLRLQAPFLIGVVVLLIHAIATFAPQIVLVYQSLYWWVWLAIGGVIIVVLAARFEKNMRAFRSVAMRIAALR